MKKIIFALLFMLATGSSRFALAQVNIDYNQPGARTTGSADFTNDFKIYINNVPLMLPNPITVNDGGGRVNLVISQQTLSDAYAAAVSTIGQVRKIEFDFHGGKLAAPFQTDNVTAPLAFRFNGKSYLLNNGPPVNPNPNPPPISLQAGYTPGFIYYDAITLKQLLNGGSAANIYAVLGAYKITNLAQANSYLQDVFARIVNPQDNSSLSLSNALSAAGNLNVTSFADGLAKFLVQRSKEELNVAFFSKFQEFMNNYPEIKTVFPSTYDFLNNINAYQYAAMLPTLRAAFQKDLNSLCGNVVKLRDLTTTTCTTAACTTRVAALNELLNKHVTGRSVIASLILTNSIIKGNNVAVALNTLASDKVCAVIDTSSFYNIANSIQLADLVSQSLLSTDKENVWVTKQQIAVLLSDPTTLKIYLGLLYAKDAMNTHHVSFSIGGQVHTLEEYLDLLEPQINTGAQVFTDFKTNLQQLANAADEVNSNIKNIASLQSQNTASAILLYANYATSITDVITDAVNLLPNNTGVFNDLSGVKSDISKFTSVINDAVNCSYDIKSQNYGALVLHTSDLLSTVLAGRYNFKDNYVKYGTFMADIVQAKNSDEVNAAIEAAVLPVGSASIKRETSVNIAVNAFIGPNFGWEYLPALKANKWSQVFGLTAPVGVAFSLGNFWGDENTKPGANGRTIGGKSMSLFVSLIDVGALASYRLQNDSSSVTSQIKLQNIVSPGLFIYYGFGKTPISLGFGAQYGPQLRSISSGGVGDINQNYYIKIGFSLVVDIPFFNLYTKSKE